MAYTTIDDPSVFFQTLLYTGNASNPRNLTNTGNSDLKPDFIWLKDRTINGTNHVLTNSSLGFDAPNAPSAGGQVASDSEGAVNTPQATYGYISAQLTDGFTASAGGTNGDTVNKNSSNFVAWQWKINAGSTSSNSDGQITSTVQVNQSAGISIIEYTGTSSQKTVGHGLGVKPDILLFKNLETSANWYMFNKNFQNYNTYAVLLSYANAAGIYSNAMAGTEPTSSVFTVGNDTTTGNGDDHICYAFAEKQGYSKFGKYTGNGNENGPFVYTGFKPAFVLIKSFSATHNWHILDNQRSPANPVTKYLLPDTTGPEATFTFGDFLSNGFKWRSSSGTSFNGSGISYMYMAFAENPFVTSTGIPTTAR